jgi:hypothetical protein
MPTREHFHRPVQDDAGNLMTNSIVRLLDPGTTDLIMEAIYSESVGGTPLPNPFTIEDGVIDFYLDQPQIVRIGVTPSGSTQEIYFENVSVGNTDFDKETFSFTLAGMASPQVGNLRFYIEEASVIEVIRVSVGTPPAGQPLIVDVNKNGNTIFTSQASQPTIPAGGNTSTATPNDPVLEVEDYLTIDIDQVGTDAAGSDLVVQVRVRRV